MQPRSKRRRTGSLRHPMGTGAVLASTALLSYLVKPANSQGLPFYWYFDTQDNFTIQSCYTIQIGFQVNTNSTVKVQPPYYLIAYPLGQTPQVFEAPASATDRWSWQVAYPPGTQLLLSFVDSIGNTGGVGPVYTMVQGVSCSFYPTAPPSSFSFTYVSSMKVPLTKPFEAEASLPSPRLDATQPATCQNVSLNVQGGDPPYTLTVAVANDTPRNTTFPNSDIFFSNALTGGSNFIVALSDSSQPSRYAASSTLLYSGGGSDTSCFSGQNKPAASGGPTSGGRHSESGNKGLGKAELAGIVAAIVAALAAAAFLLYRRRKKRQANAMAQNGYGNGPKGSNGKGWNSNGSSPGRGPEKKGGLAGGMWRPESPTEYPGIAPVPVRFRVTNPDDDARSEFSGRTGLGSRGPNFDNDSRLSLDTFRTGNSTPRNSYGRQSQRRRSLLAVDTLYPPGPQYASLNSRSNGSPTTPDSSRPLRGPPSMDDVNEAWPTYSSAASSSTEDHYMDQPASSAGALGGRRGQPVAEKDLEEVIFDDESYAGSTFTRSEFDRSSVLTRAESVSSNAYGSPFADSQRVR